MSSATYYDKIGDYSSSSSPNRSSNDEESEGYIQGMPRRPSRRWQISSILHWVLHAIALVVLTIVLSGLIDWSALNHKSCVRNENAYSPVVEDGALDAPLVDYRFIGSLWYKSPFKGPPTPEVEDAWQSAMKYGMISISEEDVTKVGHNLSAARFPPETGGDYIGVAMGTHQIHCLHYIWQDHHISHYPDMEETKSTMPLMYERHYEHCVDYIRQSIMCNFDAHVMTYNWVRDHQSPTPNGNTVHKCVDWDALMGKLKERAVEMPENFVWHQPPDAQPWTDNP